MPVPWAWQMMEQTLIAVELHSTTVCNSSLKDQEGLSEQLHDGCRICHF